MSGKRIAQHIGIVAAGILLTVVLPLSASGGLSYITEGAREDAVSGATVKVDKPSGEFLVLINRQLHTDQEKLGQWETFFSGGEISYIFEDLACDVVQGDAAAGTLAESFIGQLPENQMKMRTEDSSMLSSRVDAGKFDIVILSREYAEALGLSEPDPERTVQIHVKGGA